MREAGVILGEQAVIDWRVLGWEVEVSLRFTLDKTHPRGFFTDGFRQQRFDPFRFALNTEGECGGEIDARMGMKPFAHRQWQTGSAK